MQQDNVKDVCLLIKTVEILLQQAQGAYNHTNNEWYTFRTLEVNITSVDVPSLTLAREIMRI